MLPFLKLTQKHSKKYVVAFQGINYGEGYQDGEFSNCENVSSAMFPCISQRYARTLTSTYTSPSTLHAKDKLLVVHGTSVVYDGSVVGTVTEGRKQIATIGNYIVIFPDKKFYNVSTVEFGSIDASYSGAGLTFTDSTITTPGNNWPFKAGDAVEISGCSVNADNNKSAIIREVSGKVLTFYSNTFTEGTETGAITLKREAPALEFVCESNNRLWGVKGNTIYGSKYGDPFNFQVFDGLTGDSYYIDVGSDGPFTGCIAFSSHVCFFKEHVLHKLYGSKPSNFQLVTSQVYGVQAGSERSMCIINETLLYKGVNGIYAYNGGVPELLSEKFGNRRYSEACAASDGSRYYISMKRGTEWGLYVYDVSRNIWMREDSLHCVDMAFHGGYVYLLDSDGKLWKVDEAADRSDMHWSVTLCPFSETINERKGYSKFHLRLELEAGAWLTVEIRRNTDTKWQKVYTTHDERARTLSIPIIPARCDSVEIRLTGKGVCTLRTLVRQFFTGSDV